MEMVDDWTVAAAKVVILLVILSVAAYLAKMFNDDD
jgi:hypothetical protein